MINRLLPLMVLLCLTTTLTAQHVFWRDASVDPGIGRSDEGTVEINNYRAISLNMIDLKALLATAPEENAANAGRRTLEITFPLPDGGAESFRVYRSPVMMPRLAAKYPNIQSFRVVGTESANSQGRFTYGTDGLSGVLRTRSGEVYIDALAPGRDDLYRVYFGRDVWIKESGSAALACGFSTETAQAELLPDEWEAEHPLSGGRSGAEPVDLHVYTLALACTGEYAQSHGGTVESVLSSFNEAVSLLNQIYENDVAIRFMLIEGTERLIWLDPQFDPFVNANSGQALLSQISEAFTNDAKITLTSFDVGHLFTGNCTDVGGVAILKSACNFGRERGVTCHSSTNVNLMVKRIMAHEIGHQFSASHSFTNCPPSQGAVASGKAVEPGSGSTIMSYAGLCGNQNLVGDNDAYFHVQSLEEILSYTREGTGRTCATRVVTDNTAPAVQLDYASGFFIPVSTPFQLEGASSDVEDESLTFCWEQVDTGPLSPLGAPEGNTPLFRSFLPSTAAKRVFPSIGSIVTGTPNRNETLPDYERDLTFRLTVRDNHEGGGGVAWQQVAFRTTESAGPFVVLSPDTDRPVWEAGTYQPVLWQVANTDRSPVNCRWVNILLSTDGGYNYPFVLATGVPNTGSAMVPVPNVETVAARIKVEAADNVFFNISSQNFRISAPQHAGFTMMADRNSFDVCLPDQVVANFTTQSFLGYNEDITFEVIGGLPAGAGAGFNPPTLRPGESTQLRIDLPDGNNTGQYPVQYRAFVPGQDTIQQTVFLDLISNDFSDIALLDPVDGTRGVGLVTSLTWTASANAGQYRVELATDPSFQNAFLLDAALLDDGATQFDPDVILEENTLHYWRLRPINPCGAGDYLPVSTFHTQNVICTSFSAKDTPVAIPGSGLPTKESIISVDFDGTISDINIPAIKGNYQPVSSLRLSLISPSGTEVILFDGNCGNTTDLALGFDDEAPNTIVCPPDDNIVFQPMDSLAAFIGEPTRGDWILRVKVIKSGFGGVGNIGSWQLEFCANSTPVDPILVTNDTLYVPPGQANPLSAGVLEVQDEDNTPDQLTYTLVQAPRAGFLYFLDEPLVVGDQFRQITINAFNLTYLNVNSEAVLDSFIFVVEDGTGGWISPQPFTIKVDADATVAAQEPDLSEAALKLFPNPAHHTFNLQLAQPLEQRAALTLFDARGRVVQQRILAAGIQDEVVAVGDLPRGLYFVRLQSGILVLTRRVVLQ